MPNILGEYSILVLLSMPQMQGKEKRVINNHGPQLPNV